MSIILNYFILNIFRSVKLYALNVHSVRRLENDKIDLAIEQQKLDKTLMKIEEQKRGYLEEMKNHTVVRKRIFFICLLFFISHVWFLLNHVWPHRYYFTLNPLSVFLFFIWFGIFLHYYIQICTFL